VNSITREPAAALLKSHETGRSYSKPRRLLRPKPSSSERILGGSTASECLAHWLASVRLQHLASTHKGDSLVSMPDTSTTAYSASKLRDRRGSVASRSSESFRRRARRDRLTQKLLPASSARSYCPQSCIRARRRFRQMPRSLQLHDGLADSLQYIQRFEAGDHDRHVETLDDGGYCQ